MLIAKNLSKHYKEVQALSNINLKIRQGEVYGMLGPNGAGKTTTISILSSLLKPDSGEIYYEGESLFENLQDCKKLIGVVPQEIALYEDLTAGENLKFWGALYGLRGKSLQNKIDDLLAFTGLSERKNHKIKTYSGGMKRRINIAAALLHDPKIVFMDEPTVGIDPQSRNLIFEVIEELHRRGLTMIYTTHYMEEAERLCDRIGIIDEGKIIAEGSLEELKRQSSIQEEIHLEFANPEKISLNEIEKRYAGQIIMDKDKMTLSTTNANSDLPELISLCAQTKIKIDKIDIRSISLESIFLELTGKSLRD